MKKIVTLLLLFLILFSEAGARESVILEKIKSKYAGGNAAAYYYYPHLSYRVHRNGRFWNTIYNHGIIGNHFDDHDYDLQLTAPDHFFPRYMRIRHGFFTALWFGGVVGEDTLVSTALDVTAPDKGNFYWQFHPEMLPDYYPFGDFDDRVTDIQGSLEQLAQSEVMYSAVYTDTFIYDYLMPYNTYDQRYHKPIGIEVTQDSYSWSYKYAEDFMIIDYTFKNIGDQKIENGFVGFYHRGANHYTYELPLPPALDDIPGYIDSLPYEFEQIGMEPFHTSWTIDYNGYPQGNVWSPISTRNCLGIAPLKVPATAYIKNFNWWVNDYNRSWGPRNKWNSANNQIRMYSGDFGQPLTDKEKYHMMAYPEVDSCGYYAAKDWSSYGWNSAFEYADDIVDGFPVNYLTSFGPFDLEPGEIEKLTIFYGIGEKVHNIPYAYREYFDPQHPEDFMQYLDFKDLIDNIRWAKRIYDNPGIDTDLDGDSGKYIFIVDSLTMDSTQVFYTGDGVPDFKGASPPPPPEVRVLTEKGKLIVRWNGYESEKYFDSFSLLHDFEGYRVYLARSLDENDISLMASYDQENYNRYKWNQKKQEYDLLEMPFTIDSLRVLYGAQFEPLDYTRTVPLSINGTYYFFTQVDYNDSQLDAPNKIHKLYPDATNDTTDVDDEGRIRFYEYEYVIDKLLPSIPYYVTVTAFDFGFPAKSLPAMESSTAGRMIEAFALDQDDAVLKDGQLDVICYPNPYRIDADYAGLGYENRFTDFYAERARNLYFANLPDRCTISIYSLNGDHIRTIEHNEPTSSGTGGVERFDLLSRNEMTLVTGIYYWVVEAEMGKQIGKLVVIK